MWQLWQMASSTHQRPSTLLGIVDPYVAYCLDQAVVNFGEGVEAILQGITHKNAKLQTERRRVKLLAILSETEEAEKKAMTKQFAPPAATKRKKAQ